MAVKTISYNSISSKLNTPLNGIKGFTYNNFLKDTPISSYATFSFPFDDRLLTLVGQLVDKFSDGANKAYINITSGYRSPEIDRKVGGSGTGQHTLGKAIDMNLYKSNGTQVPSKYIAVAAEMVGFPGIALITTNAIHLDVRDGAKYRGDEANLGNNNIPSKYGGSLTAYLSSDDPAMKRTFGSYNQAEFLSYAPNGFNISSFVSSYKNGGIAVNSSSAGGGSGTTANTTNTDEVNPEVVAALQDIIAASSIESTMASSMRGMRFTATTSRFFGSPYTFLKETDPQITITDYDGDTFTEGRTYTKNIAMEAPLVHFIPGLPTYLRSFDKTTIGAMKEYVSAKESGGEIGTEIMERVAGTEGRFFNFVPAFAEYIKYVNILCRTAALYIGIGDKTVPGTDIPYKHYNYANFQEKINGKDAKETFFGSMDEWDSISDGIVAVKNAISELKTDIFSGNQSVKLYVDTSSSFSEDLSNSTGQSQLASMFDTGQNIAKELDFWVAGEGADTINAIGNTLMDAVGTLTDGVMGLLGMDSGMAVNIGNYGKYIINGSNLVFPNMWNDSEYRKDYRFTLDLQSPYGDPESIFLNIIMPLMWMIAMTAPRQTSANSYSSPFLVRVVSKGWFSCDMGIINSISIEKGGSDAWNTSGLPLSMKIGISVSDMYTAMSIPSSTQPGLFYNNPGLLEFLAATCGVDTIIPNLALKVDTFVNMFENMVTDIPSNLYNKKVQFFNNEVMKWTKLF